MAELLKRLASLGGASFAAACCLGVTAALSIPSAIGAGFLVNDLALIAGNAADLLRARRHAAG